MNGERFFWMAMAVLLICVVIWFLFQLVEPGR